MARDHEGFVKAIRVYDDQPSHPYMTNDLTHAWPTISLIQELYDECAQFWKDLRDDLYTAIEHTTGRASVIKSQYWATAQRFFLQLSIASKVCEGKWLE